MRVFSSYPKKILFLDIDGVLNHDYTRERTPDNFLGVDPVLRDRLLQWLDDHPAVAVVLSSAWRQWPSMRLILKEQGIDFIATTPILPGLQRGREIDAWLKDHHNMISHFAIVDDMNDMKPHMNRLVQTSPKHGLREKNLRRIEILLDEPHIGAPYGL